MAKTITDLQSERKEIPISDKHYYQKLDANRLEFQCVVIEKIVLMSHFRQKKEYEKADLIKTELNGRDVIVNIELNGVTYLLPGDPYPYFIEIEHGKNIN